MIKERILSKFRRRLTGTTYEIREFDEKISEYANNVEKISIDSTSVDVNI